MKVGIASDHAGFEQKNEIRDYLESQGYEVIDEGPETDDRCDYPDFAARVAKDIENGKVERGVLVCGTGIGMAIAANKYKGIRAANVTNADMAELSRRHNDANIVCLSGRFVEPDTNRAIVDTFLTTEFDGGRHAGRVAKITASEQ